MNLKLSHIPLACALLVGFAEFAAAQHVGVLLQEVNDRVWTGEANFDISVNEVGPRTAQAEFGTAPSSFTCDGGSDCCLELPGFNTVTSTNPTLVSPPEGAASELPARTYVEWDFAPMKVDGVVSNLLYWDGSDTAATPGTITAEDVRFGLKPAPGYAIELEGQTANIAAAGESSIVPGDIITRTGSAGTLHEHRPWRLLDGDGDSGTHPVGGIYMVGLRYRVGDLDRSRTAYVVFGTYFDSVPLIDELDAAYAWVQAHEEDLAPGFRSRFRR